MPRRQSGKVRAAMIAKKAGKKERKRSNSSTATGSTPVRRRSVKATGKKKMGRY